LEGKGDRKPFALRSFGGKWVRFVKRADGAVGKGWAAELGSFGISALRGKNRCFGARWRQRLDSSLWRSDIVINSIV
jgi:hypothetical protein